MRSHISIGRLELKTPVMPASGTFGSGIEFRQFGELARLGAIVTKGVSLNPKPGNKAPRICEVKGGMINSIGLENAGIDAFLATLRELGDPGTPVVANFFGNTEDEYVEVARRLAADPVVTALEMNISCPNVKEGGICFGTDMDMVYGLVRSVRAVTAKPLWVKLTPNVRDVSQIAVAAQRGGADAVVVSNTYQGMAVDIATRKPRIANIFGGFSGPAIKPMGVFNVWRTAKAVSIPVIACGGIMTVDDVIEYLVVGASAVQVGTGSFTNPRLLWELADGFESYLAEAGATTRDLIGSVVTGA